MRRGAWALVVLILVGTPLLAQEGDRITFSLPFPAEEGGGSATGSADSLDFLRDTYVVLEGNVTATYRGQTFSAQRVEVDLETKVLTAVGNVILDEGPNRLAGESLVWDLDANTGTISEATAYMAPDMYFKGATIERTGEDLYTLSKGSFSSCEGEVPLWSFRVGEARIKIDGFARAKNVTMRAKKMPFLYIPYMMYPAKQKRTSGFLMPNLGYSEARGYSLGLAYFQTLGKSADTTFFFDVFQEDYIAAGAEVRYRPSEGTVGRFDAYFVDDPESDELRWRLDWDHVSNELPLGLRGAIRYVNFSDFQFFQDFDRDLNRVTIRSLYSSAYLSGAWGAHSVNMLVDDREVLNSSGNNLRQQQLPELEYRLRQTQLGKLPLYLAMTSGAHYFSVKRDPTVDNEYGRLYAFPTLTLPLQSLPWLQLNFTASGRYTHYTDSIDPETQEPLGEQLSRFIPAYGAQIVGPSFSRVFDRPMGSFSKFKHVIEPRWRYQFSDTFEDQDQVLQFDEVDRLRGSHIGSFTLTNRLVAKPEEDPDNPGSGSAREIMSLDLSTSYSFDNMRPLQTSQDGEIKKQSGPLSLRYRLNPSQATSLSANANYNTIYGQITNSSISGRFFFGAPRSGGSTFTSGLGRHNIGLSWGMRFDPETGMTNSNQVGIQSAFELGRYRLQAAINLDLGPKGTTDRPTLQQQRYFIERSGKCTGWLLELREYNNSQTSTRDVRFAITLKNIGSFLDLGTGGNSTGNSYRGSNGFGY
jgi:LPS-assembly protein